MNRNHCTGCTTAWATIARLRDRITTALAAGDPAPAIGPVAVTCEHATTHIGAELTGLTALAVGGRRG